MCVGGVGGENSCWGPLPPLPMVIGSVEVACPKFFSCVWINEIFSDLWTLDEVKEFVCYKSLPFA